MRNMRRAGSAATQRIDGTWYRLPQARTARRAAFASAGLFAISAVVTGCAAPAPTPKQQLTVAYHDLDQRQYDSAYLKADAVLRKQPAGPGSAEALYLEGRVAEAKAEQAGTAGKTDDARTQLTTAANLYLRALSQSPVPSLEGLCRCGLANAAFYLDDYPTAVREWGLAFPLVERPEDKAWVLYRVGLCQQRLGWFEMADRSFNRLQKEFAAYEPATKAAPRIGQRAFYLQVGVYSSVKNAEAEVTRIRAQRLAATRTKDPATGRQTVRAGPYTTYIEARAAQAQLAKAYPDAIVIP
jgi:tetratricopeptide (TPR) repeat protein